MRASEVPTMSVEALIPYARNSRTHSEAQVAQIAASIREFGFTNPVLIDGEGGIIAGHGRVLAAQSLGLEAVPVLVLDHLTDAQRRAYVIADNKLAMNGGWDEDLLRAEVAALADEGVDLGLVGFSDDEIDELLGAALDFEDGVKGALSAEAEFEPAGTNLVLGAYRVSITRQEYEAWLDGVRLSAGFEKADILAEMRRRMGV